MTTLNPLTGDFTPDPTEQWYSVGCICTLLQISPDKLYAMMEHCELRFRKAIDGAGFVRGDDVQKMFDAAHKVRGQINEVTRNN